jgi:hypothetical protein
VAGGAALSWALRTRPGRASGDCPAPVLHTNPGSQARSVWAAKNGAGAPRDRDCQKLVNFIEDIQLSKVDSQRSVQETMTGPRKELTHISQTLRVGTTGDSSGKTRLYCDLERIGGNAHVRVSAVAFFRNRSKGSPWSQLQIRNPIPIPDDGVCDSLTQTIGSS